MIHYKKTLLVALMTTTLLTASGVCASGAPTPGQTMTEGPADKDFGRLSHEGSRAFEDLALTRVAIFEGRIEEAKKFVSEAEQDFEKAKTDDTVFTKAEADLTSSHAQSHQATDSGRSAASTEAMKKPISWLPVNGAITINGDYTLDPAKAAAVTDANKNLKKGDRKAALEKLKLAAMEVDITLAVVPLEQTIKDVHQAASLINDGKYYEGSQVLRQVQESERFELVDSDMSKASSSDTAVSSKHPAEGTGESTPAAK